MDRLFLDANVLFSAAYNPTSPLIRLWELSEVVLISSAYAVQEARQNLAVHRPNRLGELEHVVKKLYLIDAPPNTLVVAGVVGLPEKDLPILLAAIEAKATHGRLLCRLPGRGGQGPGHECGSGDGVETAGEN